VFEIGNSLREARLRQGLDLPRIEEATKIRGKYLRALEEERFEVLPADTYVKGFLKTYADYLGLEGQLYLDEYNSRFTTAEEAPVAQSAAPKRRSRPVESNFIIVALAGIVAITVLVVVGLREASGDSQNEPPIVRPTTGQTTTERSETETAAGPAAAQQARPVRRAKLVLTAVRGDCWMQVRAGGVNGKLIFEGTVEQGQSQRFVKYKRLWLELGAPGNLNAKLNGRRVGNWPTRSAVIVVTAAQGVRTISTAG
jgi:cytoskeleton protein RodZ